MNIFLLAVIISMIFYLGIGWYVGRKVKDLDDKWTKSKRINKQKTEKLEARG